ncbi:MAG: hypothetical protein IPK16_23240 [Anaerolineales bacterium]|nr:hypothetical protein [Anaerolineales bacterium]
MLQHRPDDEIGNWEEGDDLDKDEAVQTIDVVDAGAWSNPEQLPGDEAIASEEQDGCNGNGKGRRDGRQQGDHMYTSAEGHAAPHQRIGEDEAQNSSAVAAPTIRITSVFRSSATAVAQKWGHLI